MRKFNINVNGKSYSVEVEEITDGAVSAVSTPVQQPATEVSKTVPVVAPAGNGKPVKSQMPGLVKKLCFANGATVKEGETIIILEAMKMDTPISAPFAGVITYSTQEGANVDSGAILCTIA